MILRKYWMKVLEGDIIFAKTRSISSRNLRIRLNAS